MAKQKEAVFRAKVMSALARLPNSKWFRIEQQTIRGTPDCLGVIRGRFIAIEFKRGPEATISALQAHALEQVYKAGGDAIVMHPENWEDLFRVLCAFAETGNPAQGWFQ